MRTVLYELVCDPCAALGLLMSSVQAVFLPGVEVLGKPALWLEDCLVWLLWCVSKSCDPYDRGIFTEQRILSSLSPGHPCALEKAECTLQYLPP